MKPLEVAILGIDAQTWVISLAVMLGVFAALLKLRKYVGKWMGEMTGEVNLDSGKLVREIITRTGTYFLLAVSLYAGSMVLVLPPFISSKLGLVIFLLFLLQISQWGSWLITYAVNRTVAKKKTAGSDDTAIFGVVKFFLKTPCGQLLRSWLWTTLASTSPLWLPGWEWAALPLPLPLKEF